MRISLFSRRARPSTSGAAIEKGCMLASCRIPQQGIGCPLGRFGEAHARPQQLGSVVSFSVRTASEVRSRCRPEASRRDRRRVAKPSRGVAHPIGDRRQLIGFRRFAQVGEKLLGESTLDPLKIGRVRIVRIEAQPPSVDALLSLGGVLFARANPPPCLMQVFVARAKP